MDLELNLVKNDDEVWGFRLTGGAEYGVPFTIVHVDEGGIADKGGLVINDIILKVNGTSTLELTHNENHELLMNSGNCLVLGVRRNFADIIQPTGYDDENNEEISSIMQPYLKNGEEFELQRQTQFEIINPADANAPEIATAPEENKENVVPNDKSHTNAQERRWSTFLQKPAHPKPIIKKQEDSPQAAPYRVVIKKQPKKDPKKPQNEMITVSQEINAEEETQTNLDENVTESTKDESEENQDEIEEEVSKADEEQITENTEEEVANETDADAENERINKVLEEKLAEVQRQLEALSKLPSTIQSTIDAVTKQIASIVSANTKQVEEVECEENSEEINADLEEQNSAEEEVVEDENHNEEIEDAVEQNEAAATEEVEETEPREEEVVELTEEEKEAERIEQELLEKQKKDLSEEIHQRRLKQKPTLPLKPIERPIILPGGRRWSQPDDACPVTLHKKMSDDKIANTIETYSEVLIGRTKGLTIGTKYGHGLMRKRPSTGRVPLCCLFCFDSQSLHRGSCRKLLLIS